MPASRSPKTYTGTCSKGEALLADGTEAKIVTGVDDHSRYCLIALVVARAIGGKLVPLPKAPAGVLAIGW